MANKLTLQELESHLWGAANILRGKIDSSDYKHYIFGLLFFKRISDVWQEEYDQRMKEFGDKKLASHPDEHRFNIPSGAFWKDVRKHATNIGEQLNIAFRKIEDKNLRLKGVFQDVDFNNKEHFPDTTLEMLLQHFDKFSLKNADVEADILGNAYEYLIAKFADDAGKKGGEFYTPKMVVYSRMELLHVDKSDIEKEEITYRNGFYILYPTAISETERNKIIKQSLKLWMKNQIEENVKSLIKAYG